MISAKGDSRVFLGLGLVILSLGGSYMILRLINKLNKKTLKPEGQTKFNNTKHNPALCGFSQTLSLIIFATIVVVLGMSITKKGPNGIILGYLPLLLTGLFFIPSQFYISNANLRSFVAKEIKERLGMDRRNQRVWTTNIEMRPNPQDEN